MIRHSVFQAPQMFEVEARTPDDPTGVTTYPVLAYSEADAITQVRLRFDAQPWWAEAQWTARLQTD
jgi:hypothetical protein